MGGGVVTTLPIALGHKISRTLGPFRVVLAEEAATDMAASCVREREDLVEREGCEGEAVFAAVVCGV